jgi:DNA-binding transcriptional LysR family regulator
MDLNQVAVFVRVVEAGTFTQAGVDLGLPKSSVSRTVAHLEEQLGVRLLQRTTRKLQLTDAGRTYFEQTRPLLSELAEANRAAAKLSREPRGTVRVTAPVDIGVLALADVIAKFSLKYPRIHVDLSMSARRVDLVLENFDLAVRAAPKLDDSSLVARKVGSLDLGLFASAAYLKRRGEPRTVAELAEHDCILFRGRDGKATWELDGPHGTESVTVKGPVNVDEVVFIRQAAESGIGIAQITMWELSGRCSSDSIVRVLPQYRVGGVGLYVVTSSMKHFPARVTLFRDHLIAELTARQWSPP